MSMKTLAGLLEMVAGLQRDLGLQDTLPLERDIVAIIGMYIEDGNEYVKTETLISHPLLASAPKASLHRALRSLMNRGLLAHPEGCKAGRYILTG
ncbi:hypothetical protein ACFFRS_27490, partial [Saccharopolyspora hordei]|uniref:hypothetical protein n=1 Tax=Saccharopolyspora hordei TaxID=1838 RepID=UPI0035EB368A